MDEPTLWQLYGDATRTAVGFFWKSGWAFVLGYAISAMIQTFVPRARLTRRMGNAGASSVSLASLFGAISSSCSFAALSAARALFRKGAHFVATVAFMFASTNLVIELGILILIFLGWQFLAAEIVGGVVLIVYSSLLIRWTYPHSWIEAARERLEERGGDEDEDFDPWRRIRSADGWDRVGNAFVGEWRMVWEEILIGFTVAGFVAVLIPAGFWAALFLVGSDLPAWLVTVQNALVAPFVAAATFIGSMGNIPLATVLNANGVLFAGIMGFIYSDLMVPPLVRINAKYYGWRVALYIAGVMFVSIVATALTLHAAFAVLGITPESARVVSEIARFEFDYTFWLNLVFVFVAAVLIWLHRRHVARHGPGDAMGTEAWKRIVAVTGILLLLGGAVSWAWPAGM